MSVEDTIRSEGLRVPAVADDMTLDQAIDWMESHPCTLSAVNLLDVASQYHDDGMIAHGTYRENVKRVSSYLRSRT